MLRSRLLPLLALLCLCALPAAVWAHPGLIGPSRHAPKKESREQVAELEQQWRIATLAGDVPALERLLSDDYVGISWTGQVNTKTSQLDRLRSRSLVLTKLDLSDVKVKVVGPVAIVTCRSEMQGTNDGVAVQGSFVYTRIYQRSAAGEWKITNFESTRIPVNGRMGRRGGN